MSYVPLPEVESPHPAGTDMTARVTASPGHHRVFMGWTLPPHNKYCSLSDSFFSLPYTQVLLERYGMTEIGMALSNPYRGERLGGAVGRPLPGVEVSLFDDSDNQIDITHMVLSDSSEGGSGSSDVRQSLPGEIRVKGDNVFLEYWGNPAATEAAFHDGWFCTGDIAVVDEMGYYRIMGRSSVDIIKSGGYKLSALEIEAVLLTHEAVAECGVVGVPDEVWGEALVAFVVMSSPGANSESPTQLSYDDMKSWCSNRMSSYKIPKKLVVLEALPRNAMGKVMKPSLKSLL